MSVSPSSALKEYIRANPDKIGKVVDFVPETDRLLHFDFTADNQELSAATIADTSLFTDWVHRRLELTKSRYGIGGYNEHRTIYARSSHFGNEDEARRLHLGVDIWGPAGTAVYNPIEGKVHSFKFNDRFGDYGATIILEHQLGDLKLHSLYGHLSLASLKGLHEGMPIAKGEKFAEFGIAEENGHWPPHLHFQLIFDVHHCRGDFHGVCRFAEREKYLQNCPDPNDILAFSF
jgi:peptidoglycan LD-endopeptidase LytH